MLDHTIDPRFPLFLSCPLMPDRAQGTVSACACCAHISLYSMHRIPAYDPRQSLPREHVSHKVARESREGLDLGDEQMLELMDRYTTRSRRFDYPAFLDNMQRLLFTSSPPPPGATEAAGHSTSVSMAAAALLDVNKSPVTTANQLPSSEDPPGEGGGAAAGGRAAAAAASRGVAAAAANGTDAGAKDRAVYDPLRAAPTVPVSFAAYPPMLHSLSQRAGSPLARTGGYPLALTEGSPLALTVNDPLPAGRCADPCRSLLVNDL